MTQKITFKGPVLCVIQYSVTSWAVFPPNWAGFDTKLRVAVGFLGYFLFKAAGFWASKILWFNRTTFSCEKLCSLASQYVQSQISLVPF